MKDPIAALERNLVAKRVPQPEERFSLDEYMAQAYVTWMTGGNTYAAPTQTYTKGSGESIGGGYVSVVHGGYSGNGAVFSCLNTRLLVFSEARFQWQRMQGGRPGDLFDSTRGHRLDLLENPWPNGTTGELLGRMEQDGSLAGNCFITRHNGENRLRRLRPDWITIVRGVDDDSELYGDLLGYVYDPPNGKAAFLPVDEVAHFSPIPDPLAQYRGMSWITPVIREINGDTAAQQHKLNFFEHAATPNMVVRFDREVGADKFERFKELFKADQEGVHNAYRTLFLGGGADATVVGNNFEQMSFKNVVGMGETRIAAAAGVPPVLVGLSEGLQAATYSNYGQARRRFADATLRPLWRMAAGSLQRLVSPPQNARLWYDDRDIAFLREDMKDDAEIHQTQSAAIRQLIDGGFKPDAAVDAIVSGDLARLVGNHTGLNSVQLMPPGNAAPDEPTPDEQAPVPAQEPPA